MLLFYCLYVHVCLPSEIINSLRTWRVTHTALSPRHLYTGPVWKAYRRVSINVCWMNEYWLYKPNNQGAVIIEPSILGCEIFFSHYKVSLLWFPPHCPPVLDIRIWGWKSSSVWLSSTSRIGSRCSIFCHTREWHYLFALWCVCQGAT